LAAAHAYLVNVLEAQGRIEEATASLEAVVRIDPNSPMVHMLCPR
jgi:hypothetical protein